MNIVEKLWNLAKEAETQEISNAYMIALLYVDDYIREQKERERREQAEREENALEIANTLVKLYENRSNNTNK